MVASESKPILLVSNTAWNLAHFRRPLIEGLVADGHSIVAAAAPDGSEDRLKALGVRFESLAIRAGGLSPLADLSLLMKLARLIHRERPTRILTFTVKPNVYGPLVARSSGVPCIPTISGLGSALIGGGLLGTLVSGLFRAALASVPRAVFQNADDRDLFVTKGLIDRDRTDLVPGSGIDLTRFSPAPAPSSVPFTFLMIGRLLRDKGVVEYADAGRLLRARGHNVRLRLLGALGVDNPSAVPEADIARYVADETLEHLPPIDDVRPAIAAAHAVVLPSYREGVPMSLLEASAMARPLVATDVAGCRDVVADGVTGFLCPPRDSAALADAMERVMALDPAGRDAMGAAARARVERNFSRERVVEAYRRILAP